MAVPSAASLLVDPYSLATATAASETALAGSFASAEASTIAA